MPAAVPEGDPPLRQKSPGRRPLPEHLPRTEIVHQPGEVCPACSSAMRKVGEDVTEILDYIPGRFQVIRHVRPALSCRTCERMAQMPMPSLPIERGRPGAGLLAHILVAKYCDHLPLYRQAGIYARDGVDLDRAVMAGWVGKSVWLSAPLVEAIGDHVMAGTALHGDDTPVPVLAPGTGKTKTGRLWVYLRDERPCAGPAPPAVLYRYSADRKGEHPRRHLARFRGFLHADGYAGFGPLYQAEDGRPATVTEVFCWAHVRRKFHDLHLAGSPLAKEALDRIGRLFDIERAISGMPPEMRQRIRQISRGTAGPGTCRLSRCHPAEAIGQERSRRCDPLRALALAGADPLSRGRPPGDLEQRRRAGHPAFGSRPQELDLRRLRQRRRARRGNIHADRDGEAERPRSRSLFARGVQPNCRSPDQPHRRSAALEFVATLCHSGGMTADQIARLAIALDEVKPPVRRRIEVPLTIRLDRLHEVFQAVMGWENYHLYEFRIGRDIAYGVPDPNGDFLGSSSRPANRTTLAQLVAQTRNKTFKYVYDFGDDWQHTVKLEAIAAPEPEAVYPRLLSAKGRCPPEDIGGPWGYAEYLEAMADPNHERHAEMLEWCGPDFDPNAVDEAAIRKQLNRLTPRRKSKTTASR